MPRSKLKPEPMSARPVRVMLELAVDEGDTPTAILRVAEELASAGFQVDRKYPPVPISARREDQRRLEGERRRAVIVRGMVSPQRIGEVGSRPTVLKVWTDSKIEPFVKTRPARRRARPPRNRGKVPRPRGKTVPPPDCSNGSAPRGTIGQVRVHLGVDQVWSAGYKGDGIVVGMVDGGICAKGRTLPSTSCGVETDRVIGGWPTTDWGTTAEHWDGHGNMTAFDVLGIAPGAQLYDIRIVNVDTGNPSMDFAAWVSDAVQAYEWAIIQHQTDGTPHILSNSWGLYKRSVDPSYAEDPASPFARKVEAALTEGILVVFAAGNCGSACPSSKCGSASVGPDSSILGPNGHPAVMTVGAVNLDETWVGYSSQGKAVLPPNAPKPDFCAITEFTGYHPTIDPSSASDGGTSAAAAIAAGVVALLKQKASGLTQAQAQAALIATAKDLFPTGIDPNTGAGLIRAKKAFDSI